MPRYNLKCATPGCHRHIKLNELGIQQLREAAQEAGTGASATLICPSCLTKAFNQELDYSIDGIDLGELVVEAAKKSPRWRVVIRDIVTE